MSVETISVIMPTFNRHDLIPETIEALLAQKRPIDQIIVVDDGSSDATADVLASYGERITRLHQENSGKAVALNNGLALASGSVIWIMDDDDLPVPEACEILVTPLETDKDLDFVAGRHIDFEVNPRTGEREFRDPGYMRCSSPDRIFPDLLEGCHIFQPGLMVRKTVYGTVGLFDRTMIRSQDYQMILRIARSHRGVQLEETVFYHREHLGVRGNAEMQFAADQNADRWAQYNARIFAPLMAELEDCQLFGRAEWEATPSAARPRMAHIARGTIFARQRMWADAMSAFESALAQDRDTALSQIECAYLSRASLSPLGCPELLSEKDLQKRLKAIGRTGGVGAQMRAILKRSVRWRLKLAMRTGDWSSLRTLLWFFATA